MAQNSPAVFNVHVKGFIDVIWNALRHPSREIRESAVEALSVGLYITQAAKYLVQYILSGRRYVAFSPKSYDMLCASNTLAEVSPLN